MYEALINYINKAIEEGTSPQELKSWLLKHGYTEDMLREALGSSYLDYFPEKNFEIYIDTLLFSIGVPLVLLSSLFFLHSFELKLPPFIDYVFISLIAMFLGLIMTDLYTRRPVKDPLLIFCIFLTSFSSAVIPAIALYLQKLYDLTMLRFGNYGINVDVFEVMPNPVLLAIVAGLSTVIPFFVFLIKRREVAQYS